MVLLEGFCPAGALYFVLAVLIQDMVTIYPANMVLAKALLLFGLGYTAVAQCVRKKDGSCLTCQSIREIAIGGFQFLKGNMGRPKGGPSGY